MGAGVPRDATVLRKGFSRVDRVPKSVPKSEKFCTLTCIIVHLDRLVGVRNGLLKRAGGDTLRLSLSACIVMELNGKQEVPGSIPGVSSRLQPASRKG